MAMEATSDYWKPVYYLLEAEGFTCWLLNAKHVKNVPGRPKTDKLGTLHSSSSPPGTGEPGNPATSWWYP
ncbi:hypothetical protein [Nonomuraea glycinis]|uniref:hypothetical protein n=1 Tax=Nonomuraea glycinis TaxID=2047744 RepID=UPI003F4BB35A